MPETVIPNLTLHSLKPYNIPIDVSERHKIRRPTDFLGFKIVKNPVK